MKALVLDELCAVIRRRALADDASGSWTARLLSLGVEGVARKVGEEALEVVLAAVGGEDDEVRRRRVVEESADLLYHLLVLWEVSGVDAGEVWGELEARRGVSGIVEKEKRGRRG